MKTLNLTTIEPSGLANRVPFEEIRWLLNEFRCALFVEGSLSSEHLNHLAEMWSRATDLLMPHQDAGSHSDRVKQSDSAEELEIVKGLCRDTVRAGEVLLHLSQAMDAGLQIDSNKHGLKARLRVLKSSLVSGGSYSTKLSIAD